MRVSKMLMAAALTVVLAGLVALVMPAPAEAQTLTESLGALFQLDLSYAELGLVALRKKLGELETRARTKLAEVQDDTPSERAAEIEDEHSRIIEDIEETRALIAKAEQEESNRPGERNPAAADELEVERRRSAEITTMSIRHAMPADFASEHIAAGTSLDRVRQLVLDHVAQTANETRISPRTRIVSDEGDTMREAMQTAILHRANPGATQIDDAARQYRGMSLIEMGRVFIEETQGIRLRNLSRREIATVLLGMETRAGMHSTSDFPEILANVVSKRLRNAYETAPQHWKRISRQSNAPDFKQKAVVQLANLPNFKEVREGGEFEYAALTEAAEKYALSTYGRIVAITRQTLINDDLGAFDRLPMLLGRAAAEQEASIFWAILVDNPNMSDGTALFHANHGNLAGSGTAIDETNLSAARAAMRKQKGIAAKAADREPLNIMPKFLIVSPDKETEAQKILTAVLPNATSGVNVFQNSMDLLVEARLTGNAWYLSADPAQIDTIEYAYLDGEEGLYTETRIGWEVDGIEVKGRVDFAAKAIDWRGFYKNGGD